MMRTIKREIVGAIIVSADNKVLLGKAGVFNGKWVVPGGGVEPGESKKDALQRELREELQLDVHQDDMRELDSKNDASSEKTDRETGEKKLVRMSYTGFLITLPLLAEEIELVTEEDFIDPTWFTDVEAQSLEIGPGATKNLIEIGFITIDT